MDALYREAILDHYRHPRHKGHLEHADISHFDHNPFCGDEITLELDVKDGIIRDAAFTGVGCAISQASTSMMIDLIKGESVEKAEHLAKLFIAMIKGEVTDEEELEELDEAMALKNISTMPARVKCAVLSWHTLGTALKNET